jgi:transcriptional regulator with XRE-family HTH domain
MRNGKIGLDSAVRNRHAGAVDESRQWAEFGKWLAERREERGLRRRDAAKRAKIPEAAWRDLETGRKEAVGAIRLLPNPSDDVLERVAGVLELPVEAVLARIGRHEPGQTHSHPAGNGHTARDRGRDGSTLEAKLRRLSERDRALVGALVDAMLEHEQA